jgi:hypothetical protein
MLQQRNFTILSDHFHQLSEDSGFNYYDNRGVEGIFGVPDGNGDYIYAYDLAKARSDAEGAGK